MGFSSERMLVPLGALTSATYSRRDPMDEMVLRKFDAMRTAGSPEPEMADLKDVGDVEMDGPPPFVPPPVVLDGMDEEEDAIVMGFRSS